MHKIHVISDDFKTLKSIDQDLKWLMRQQRYRRSYDRGLKCRARKPRHLQSLPPNGPYAYPSIDRRFATALREFLGIRRPGEPTRIVRFGIGH